MDRSGGIHAGALGRLLDDEVDGTLGQLATGPPNGLEHGRGHRRLTVAGKQVGCDHSRYEHL